MANLSQFRYLVRTLELGSMSRAAADLGVTQSVISAQLRRLEHEYGADLLQRTPTGAVATDIGQVVVKHAAAVLRHVDEAARMAQLKRLSGKVSVGLAPTTAAVLGLPLLQAMHARHPDVQVHLVEGMSGHLQALLASRELQMAVLFDAPKGRQLQSQPFVDERLFLIAAAGPAWNPEQSVSLQALAALPMVLPSTRHGLRQVVDAAFASEGLKPNVRYELDSLSVLLDWVAEGHAATLQPWSAFGLRPVSQRLHWLRVDHPLMVRRNLLCRLSDDLIGLPARMTLRVLGDQADQLINQRLWPGCTSLRLRESVV